MKRTPASYDHNWRARRDAAPRSGNFRVTYQHDLRRSSFKVQEERPAGSNNWYTCDGFTSLTKALLIYPDANPSELAVDRQLGLEKPHAFTFDNVRSDRCDACGHLADAGHHIK
jgi:hypothetical protein